MDPLTFAALAESEAAQLADIRDEGDRAAHLAGLEREIAIDQRHRYDPPADPPLKLADGTVICVDCKAPIHPERLRAIHNVTRCLDCEQDEALRQAAAVRNGRG